jgi:hypothetical protein
MRSFVIGAVVAALLAGCGGGGGGSTSFSNTTSTGTRGSVFIKDGPAKALDAQGRQVFDIEHLWLTITKAELEGHSGDVKLQLASNPFTIDVLAYATGSTLLAVGNFPAGFYEELKLTVSVATMDGTTMPGGAQQTHTLVHGGEFEAEFASQVFLDATSTVLVDFTPAVFFDGQAYFLRDEVKAFLVGGTGPVGAPTVTVKDLEGTIIAIDCAAKTLTMSSGRGTVTVDFTSATLEDDDDNAIACTAMAAGHEIEVEGTVLPSGVIQASEIEYKDAASTGGAGAHFEGEGTVANKLTTATGIKFDLVQGPTVIAHILTDANTEFEDVTAATLQNGDDVEVDGGITTAGTPPVVLAEEVEKDD